MRLVVIAALLLAGCGDADLVETAETDVAMTRRAFIDETRAAWSGDGPRPIAATIWYPAAQSAQGAAVNIPADDPIFLGGVAQQGAPARPQKAPLILLSHGTGGAAFQMMWLGRRLAARGYIAAAVDHHGNTAAESAYDPRGFMMIWERPRDLSALLDALLADPEFGPLVDETRIGAAGFSLGGYTVTALAGAVFSQALNDAFCAGPEADFTCEPQQEFEAAGAEFQKMLAADPSLAARAEREREGDYREPRIRAVAALAPALGRSLTPESLAAIDIPLLVVVGDADKVTPPATNAATIAAGAPMARLKTLPGAGHYSFLNPCTKKGRTYVSACKDGPGVDRDAIHREKTEGVAAFFDAAFADAGERAPPPLTAVE